MSTTKFAAVVLDGQYRGFQLARYRGHWYGFPTDLVSYHPSRPMRTLRHPATIWSVSREGLIVRIDEFDPAPYKSETVGEFENHRLIRHGGRVFGVPKSDAEALDLNLEEDRTADGVVCGDSPEETVERIRTAQTAKPVEFLGWLPVFSRFGNCGSHPQFGHTEAPPPGYKFVRTDRITPPDSNAPPETTLQRLTRMAGSLALSIWMFARTAWEFGIFRSLVTLYHFARLLWNQFRKTKRFMPSLRFVHSRNFQSQVMAPRGADLAFITSVPYTYGQTPWVIEIEDVTTLFYPFIANGTTAHLDIRSSPYFHQVKAFLEGSRCRGILTHMRSTADMLPKLFQSEVIAKKVSYSPLGVKLPTKFQTHETETETINLLFTNSWHQNRDGFFLRGGLDVLDAFETLRIRYPQVRLTIRASLPRLDDRYHRILESGWVRIIDRFMPARDMATLQSESHIYLLPSARIHIVSVLQAMSYGQAVVVSDGWGMDEYVDHGRNGLIVKGRGGKVTWADNEVGMLRENYGPMYAKDRTVVEGLIEAVSTLIEDRALRQRLGQAAREDVRTRYTLPQWNAALQEAFDKARAAGK